MPNYDFISPEGKKYTVTGPEGSTKEQAFGILQSQIKSGSAKEQERQSNADLIPGGGVSGSRNVGKPDNETLGDKAYGLGETALAAGAGALSGLAAPFVGAYGGLTGGIKKQNQMLDTLQENTFQPKTEAGQRYSGQLSNAIRDSGIGGLAGMNEMQSLGHLAPPGIKQAKEIVSPKIESVINSPVAQSIKSVPKLVGNAARKTLAPEEETAQLARKAGEFGIPVRPDLMYNNETANLLSSASGKIPTAGGKEQLIRDSYTSALINEIGGNSKSKRLTKGIFNDAMDKSGQIIGNISNNSKIPANEDFLNKLVGVQEEYKNYPKEIKSMGDGWIDDIIKLPDDTGVINGEKFQKLRSRLTRQMRTASDPQQREVLSHIDDLMLDKMREQLSPSDSQLFDQNRYKYAVSKSLEPLVSKGKEYISPTELTGALTKTNFGKTMMAQGNAGRIGELADVARRFVPEKEKMTNLGLVTGLGAAGGVMAASPPSAFAALAGANLYNRLGPSVSKWLIKPPQ